MSHQHGRKLRVMGKEKIHLGQAPVAKLNDMKICWAEHYHKNSGLWSHLKKEGTLGKSNATHVCLGERIF